jgi:hypothetical protein
MCCSCHKHKAQARKIGMTVEELQDWHEANRPNLFPEEGEALPPERTRARR